METTQSAVTAKLREVVQSIQPLEVMEGAGVLVRRTIGSRQMDHLDPFLLLDHFQSDNPEDYKAGFPMHPHRGIETVTYMLAGYMIHRDSIGNSGKIGPGDIQWMTSGRGILHEEMPESPDGRMNGFQLWVNLPSHLKMTEPRYQDIRADQVPEVSPRDGIKIRVVAGEIDGVRGPVQNIAANPEYLDISIPPKSEWTHPVEPANNVFAYLFEGSLTTGDVHAKGFSGRNLIVFGEGDSILVRTEGETARFLLVSGKSINEPIARYGPFVMNTREEIQQTLRELQDGTFLNPR